MLPVSKGRGKLCALELAVGRELLPFSPTIGKPCEESWAGMEGGARQRHCQLCNKQVRNFAAMTPREIERAVVETGGRLCARITRRADGTLVMQERRPRASVAAGWVASASLVAGAAGLGAQTAGGSSAEQPASGHATLFGKAAQSTLISVRSQGVVVADTSSNPEGDFYLSVTPGTYDLELSQGTSKTTMLGVTLVEDEQLILNLPISTTVEVQTVATEYSSTGGALASTRFSFLWIIRHPISYIKYLQRRHSSQG